MGRFSKFLITALFATAIVAPQAMAVNGMQVRGVGAYGEGMSGAVTAAPFDTTTMVTNPAGITRVGSRSDIHAGLFTPIRKIDYTAIGGGEDEGGSPNYLLPGVGMSAPTSEGSDLYIGMGIYVMAGMGADFGPVTGPTAFGNPNVRLFSQAQFWKLTPTIAKKFSDQLSVGFSLNIDYQQYDIQQNFALPTGTGGMAATNGAGAMGFGFTVGALYDINDKVSIGVNYSSEQSMADMKYRLLMGKLAFLDATGSGLMNTNGEYSIGLNFPQQYAIGVAYRPIPALLVTADYKWINYSANFDKVTIEGDFQSVAFGVPSGTIVANSYELDFGWEDVSVIAVGVQYQLNDATWLRAGINHSNAAVPEERAFTNGALPAVAEDSFSLGATRNFGSNWQGSFSYASLAENTVTSKGDPQGGDGTKISLGGWSLLAGISYRY
jgi:long-chain fatty acid transport protein